MADVWLMGSPQTSIEYSLITGEPRELVIEDKVWLDRYNKVELDGWQDALKELIAKYGITHYAFCGWVHNQQ